MARAKKYKMISMDTASTITGFAVFEAAELSRSGTIDKNDIDDGEMRLEEMCKSICSFLNIEKPGTVVCELTVVPRNAHTQRMLSEILGVVRGWCLTKSVEFVTYRPGVWRSLTKDDTKVPSGRNEKKKWAIQRVKTLYNRGVIDDNEAEAILLGLARIRECKNNELCEEK